jgi:hypothetical protein
LFGDGCGPAKQLAEKKLWGKSRIHPSAAEAELRFAPLVGTDKSVPFQNHEVLRIFQQSCEAGPLLQGQL